MLLPGPTLRFILGLFAVGIAIQMAFGLKPQPARKLPGKAAVAGVGGGIGWASALFGIGGGSMTVPYLYWNNISMQKAVGTSAACGLPIALMGALMNLVSGWQNADLPAQSYGFVYIPALVGIILTSIPCARLGASIAHRLPADVLKRAFSLFLFFIGGRFVLQGLEIV